MQDHQLALAQWMALGPLTALVHLMRHLMALLVPDVQLLKMQLPLCPDHSHHSLPHARRLSVPVLCSMQAVTGHHAGC